MNTGRTQDEPLLPEPAPEARRWLRIFWIAILVGYVVVFAVGLQRVGMKDHDMFLVFHEVQCWNAELFGLDKQWNPLLCGGQSAAANPQIPVLSPYALAGYVLGPFWGLRLVSILLFGLGFLGAYLYAGLWLRRREARALAAALFIGNGYFVCRFAYGHVTFLAFMLLPALLWVLHRHPVWAASPHGARRFARHAVVLLALGGSLALLVDGNPHTIMYMLIWLGLYTLGLAVARRSFAPLLLLAGATLLAGVLDAAYLWPMIDGQWQNPRLREDQFTNPLALFFFLIAPFRGNVPFLPTTDNGYELSVFVGIVVAIALVKYGRPLWARVPREMRTPLLVTGIVAFVLGIGSWKPLGVPAWLSPFDWLRELPGFRSLGVTARYWGFFALPLSLVGAAALWRLVCALRSVHVLRVCMLLALGLQLGFQVGTVLPKLTKSRHYERVPTEGRFVEAEAITYVIRPEDKSFQGEFITPTTAVIDCWDASEFIRPEMEEGSRLVRAAFVAGTDVHLSNVRAVFHSWSHIRVETAAPFPASVRPASEVRVTLNQAYHPYWSNREGRIDASMGGHLVLVTSRRVLESAGGLDVVFHDPVSARATSLSLVAWPSALALLALLLPFALRRRRAT